MFGRGRREELEALSRTVEELREELSLASLRSEDRGWVDVSALGTDRELASWDHRELIRECYRAYLVSPLAKRFVRYVTFFTLGKGVQLVAEEEAVQAVLDGFWKDERNRMAQLVREASDWLTIAGEAFFKLDYDQITAHTTTWLIDPGEITGIIYDEDDASTPTAYVRSYQRQTGEAQVGPGGTVSVQREEHIEVLPATDPETGLPSIVHLKVGGLNSSRGISELLDMLPWLKKYERWLNDRVVINAGRALFSYDVTLEGASAEEIQAYLNSLSGKRVASGAAGDGRYADFGSSRTMRSGSIRVHSDRVKWDTISPDVSSADAREDGRALKHMIACSAGLPEHWFGDTGSTNLATAKALDLPTLRQFEDRQVVMAEALRLVLRSAVQLQRMYGSILPPIPAEGEDEYNDSFQVIFPELDTSDASDKAQAFSNVSKAVAELVALGLISKGTALEVLRRQEPVIRSWEGEGGEKERLDEEALAASQSRLLPRE